MTWGCPVSLRSWHGAGPRQEGAVVPSASCLAAGLRSQLESRAHRTCSVNARLVTVTVSTVTSEARLQPGSPQDIGQIRCWARMAKGSWPCYSPTSARRPEGWAPSCYGHLDEHKEMKDELRWRDGFIMAVAMIITDNSGRRYHLLNDFSVPSTVTSMIHILSSCPCKGTL